MLEPQEDRIDWQHLPDDLLEDLAVPTAKILLQSVRPSVASDSSQNLQQLSRLAIRQALESSSGNMSQAARRLGISRQTLYRKLNP